MSRHLAPPPVRRRADRRLILAAAALAALVLAAAVLLSTCGSPAEEEPEPAPDEVQTPPDPVAEETPPEGQQPQDDFVPDGNVNPLTGLCDGIGAGAGGKTGTGSCQILSRRNIRGTGSNQSTGGSVCGNEIYADRWY